MVKDARNESPETVSTDKTFNVKVNRFDFNAVP